MQSFLLTHSHFMDSGELFGKIVKCYHQWDGHTPKNEQEEKEFGIHQMRVINVIKKWMQYNLYDFGEASVKSQFSSFTKSLSNGSQMSKSFGFHLTKAWQAALQSVFSLLFFHPPLMAQSA